MEYYRPIQTNEGVTLSIDKMVVDYYISNPDARDELMTLLGNMPLCYYVEVRNWTSARMGTFRENFTIAFQDKNSFWVGAVLNSKKIEWGRVRLEFNPNKCATHSAFLDILGWLNQHCRRMHTRITRFDLALDLTVDRASVCLVKDARVYQERRHGKEWTQYLGAKSSTVGRIKLYNKAAEAELDYPLTRLELTLDPTTPFEELPWPVVYYIVSQQIGMEEMKSTQTERFILGALLEGYGSLTDLGRKTREKIELLIEHYVHWVSISKQDYGLVLSQLQMFLNHPGTVNLAADGVIADVPPPSPRLLLPDWVQEVENSEETALPF